MDWIKERRNNMARLPPEQSRRLQIQEIITEIQGGAYQEGFSRGIATAELIYTWLSRLPDTKRQAETREWAEKAIAKAKEEAQ